MKKIYLAVLIAVFISWLPATVWAQEAATWVEKGDTLEKQGIYADAVEAYTEAIECDPGFADAYLKRGIALFLKKKTNCMESLDDLTEAIKLAPRNADASYQRGIVNYYMINNEQGRKDMEAAAALGHMGALEWIASRVEAKSGSAIKAEAVLTEETPSPSGVVKPVIYFDLDRANIKPLYRTLLDDMVRMLTNKHPRASIVLSGHTDNTGTEKHNNALSLKRAITVKEYTVKNSNISPDKIDVRAYGERMPVASNDTEKGRALNRRVVIDIYPAISLRTGTF